MAEFIIITEPDGIRTLCGSCKKVLDKGIWGIIVRVHSQIAYVCGIKKCNTCNMEWKVPLTFESEDQARTEVTQLMCKNLSDLLLLESPTLTFRYYVESP